jgi:predicted dehydrogenase
MRLGIIGCGKISGAYLETLRRFPEVALVVCADSLPERADVVAREFGARVCSTSELVAAEDVDLVLNLTQPLAHAEVSLAALTAGKHVYSEKPLATNRSDGLRLLDEARRRGLRLGSAPDTFLGPAWQEARRSIDAGRIGRPLAANASFLCRGHETWHPDPEFYYQPGGGPILDMGPYYLTALVSLLGPVRSATGMARASFPERLIESEPKRGQSITVETETHVVGVLEFASGVVANIVTSFDLWAAESSLEIYGSEGTLRLPDPNNFRGDVLLRRGAGDDWERVDRSEASAGHGRGLGVADLCSAVRDARPHRAHGALAYHVLDALLAVLDAARHGHHAEVDSSCERPAPLPASDVQEWLDAH